MKSETYLAKVGWSRWTPALAGKYALRAAKGAPPKKQKPESIYLNTESEID